MTGTAAPRWPRSWPSGSSSEPAGSCQQERPAGLCQQEREGRGSMAEVLVLAEHSGGEVKKVTCELLTAARRLGSPSVVWTGPGADAGRERLAEFGADRVYVADVADFGDYVVAPAVELLAQLVAEVAPAAVLSAGTTEGKEVAGRLAVKTNSGVLTDA